MESELFNLDEDARAECIIAAILAVATAVGGSGVSPQDAIKRYAEMVQLLRQKGNIFHPTP